MALKACRECGQQVSTDASTCPHCGVRSPTATAGLRLDRIAIAVFVLIVIAALFNSGSGEKPKGSGENPVQEQKPGEPKREKTVAETIQDAEKECGDKAQCWAKQFESWPLGSGAAGVCHEVIEKQALYDFRWTTGVFSGDPMFIGAAFAPQGKPVISYFGEAVEFQNGIGNWTRQHYECIYDPRDKTAKAVVRPGRWPR